MRALALLALAGCAALPPPRELGERLDNVALVVAEGLPRSNFTTFAKGRAQGATKGAAVHGAATAGAVLIVAATAGAAAPYVLVLGPVFVVGEAAGGALLGGINAVPSDKAQEIEAAIRKSTASLDSQHAIAARLGDSLARNALRTLDAAEAKTKLELAVTVIDLEGCVARRPFDADACPGGTRNPALSLAVEARARLFDARGGAELFVHGFRYSSPRRPLAYWTADSGRALDEELERAYRDLGERTGDLLLLARSAPLPNLSSFGRLPEIDPEYGLCWLAPRSPAAKPLGIAEIAAAPFARNDICERGPLRFPPVDSLQPLLVWDAFPRAVDRAQLDAALLARIGGVIYDLKLWDEEDCTRRSLVYERRGLASPQHRLEEPLARGRRYFWSVRARFVVDGQAMATPWAFFAPGTSCEREDVPEGQYHRFATPLARQSGG